MSTFLILLPALSVLLFLFTLCRRARFSLHALNDSFLDNRGSFSADHSNHFIRRVSCVTLPSPLLDVDVLFGDGANYRGPFWQCCKGSDRSRVNLISPLSETEDEITGQGR